MLAILRRVPVVLGAILALAASPAQAVTLDNLDGPGFEPIYGDYAPGGNCSLEPRVTIDASGFTFRAAGTTEQRSKVEFALSFFGPEYEGPSLVFFPFPLGEYEFGRVILTVNADEQEGLLRFEDNTGPGDMFTPLEAALVEASTMQLCSASATPEAATMEPAT
ncbi:MAG TPA: hypothetical protein VLA37_08270, partial [Sphingomonadaceae bacterium]|nr:hypothetical protein [Sphingomonadaceae bacterium]